MKFAVAWISIDEGATGMRMQFVLESISCRSSPDAPAGASGLLLQEMLTRTNCILIPVAPSSIDIHATANFIRDLLLAGRIRANNIRLAVVANRVRKAVPVYQPLERFLNSLNLPLVARLGDSDVYVSAAETGVGVFEMDFVASAAERQQFMPIAEWVDSRQLIVAGRVQAPLPSRLAPILAPVRPGLRVIGSGTSSHPGVHQ